MLVCVAALALCGLAACRRQVTAAARDYPVATEQLAGAQIPTPAPEEETDLPPRDADAQEGDLYSYFDEGRALFAVETLPETPADFDNVVAKVEPYTVSASLSEVSNLKPFTKARPLSATERQMLARNLFVVAPRDDVQLFFIYENNDYLNLPSFVTSDSILQLHHMVFDFVLRITEQQKLLPALEELTEALATGARGQCEELAGTEMAAAAERNAAYTVVAARLLGLDRAPTLSPQAMRQVEQELALIKGHAGLAESPLFGYRIDYSQFIPRGHYAGNPNLERFFLTMMWYGTVPFATRDAQKRINEPVVRQGLLLARLLDSERARRLWETIYEPTSFLVGTADDHTPLEWSSVADQVYGADAALADLGDPERLGTFVEAVEKLRAARIQSGYLGMPGQAIQLRLMGQRYIPDGEALARTCDPLRRGFPSGLDVMAALGSDRAAEILDDHAEIYNEGGWEGYVAARDKVVADFARLPADVWADNLYWGWLGSLRALLEPLPEGYPSVMRSEAWQDKSIHTALASWSELRRDTILYSKGMAVECGEEPPPAVKGYVEPNVVLYDRLLRVTALAYRGLRERDLLTERTAARFARVHDLLVFLRTVSEKELRNEALTDREYEQIRYLGAELERLTLSVQAPNATEWSMLSEAEQDMAVVADVHTANGGALEEAVGHANEILAIVPIEGQLVLTRGPCFSYYEFVHAAGDRLTDASWRQMLKSGNVPDPPVWTDSFLIPKGKSGTGTGDQKEYRVYGSGC